MQVDTRIPFSEYWAAVDHVPITDRREKEAVEMADVILTHSPIIQNLYRRLYPDNADTIHPDVFWFAEWIAEDADEFSGMSLPFEERNIDALFIASSWARPEKNAALVAEIVSRLPDHSVHIIGESAEQFGSATHHGFVGSRAETFQIMGRARTIVSPSFFDAAPGILFEGSAMGCNVVTSRNCGNWELCNQELLVNEYTADEFVRAIKLGREKKLADNMNMFVSRSSYRSLVDVLNGTSPATPLSLRDAVAP
jgi:glycosyltransferase involved in cell wall biosynthesis